MSSHRSRMHRAATGTSAILILLGWALGPTVASDDDPESISWRTDYARALEEARTRNQLLWLQFTAPWCPNCTRMEQDSFSHPAIRGHAQQSFVPVKLRADVNEELALHFELSGLPATVIVAPSREVLAVRQGYLGPSELDVLLADSLSRHGARGTLASAKDGEKDAARPKGDARRSRPGQDQDQDRDTGRPLGVSARSAWSRTSAWFRASPSTP